MASEWTPTERRRVYDVTGGYCHLCGRKMYFKNYAMHGHRGAWEIDHSVPQVAGGTDYKRNLKGAHTSCNRSKQDRSTRSVRASNGFTKAPPSRKERREDAALADFLGAAALVVGAVVFGPPLLAVLFKK